MAYSPTLFRVTLRPAQPIPVVEMSIKMRNINRSFLTLLLLAVCGTAWSQVRYVCEHNSGTKSFKTNEAVSVDRSGKNITVSGMRDGKVVRSDTWTYEIVAENKDIGFQAMRTGASARRDDPTDVLLGGMLFLATYETRITMFVISANAASRESSTQLLVCRSAATQ